MGTPPAGERAASSNIVGDRVVLGPLRRDLIPLYARWVNDFGTQRTLGADPLPRDLGAVTDHYDHFTARPDCAQFTIYEHASWRPIGITELQAIDLHHGTAEFVIFIGEAALRGRGYGTEATMLLLDYAFATLDLQSVVLRVYEYNLAGIGAYRRAGFRPIGRQRQCHWLGGRFWDAIQMECLREDFAAARSSVHGGGEG